MSWPKEAYLYLRQIVTPKSLPQNGGNFIYTKDDNELYLMDADGTEHAVGGGGSALTVQDENSNVSTSVTQIDFQGAGVTATSGTGEVVVTIPTPTETLPVSIIDAKGDLIVGTAADTAVRKAVGADGQVLTADSTSTGGVKWATPSGSSSSSYQPGSPDKPPSSPNAKDDEFDGTSSVTWTTTPTAPNAFDINTTRESHMHLKASGSGSAYVGKYQAVPASYPYTIVTKSAAFSSRANYQRGGGIILAPAAPTSTSNILYYGRLYSNGHTVERIIAQFGGTFVSQSSGSWTGWFGAMYFKVEVLSATSVNLYGSADGFLWGFVENINPGFTPAFMGLALSTEAAAIGCEAQFDFFRVT